MDKWPCPHCNEELLGAANRCWKCGQHVRRPLPEPVAVEPAVVATIAAPCVELTAEDVAVATAKVPPRRGSPFAIEAMLPGQAPHVVYYGDGPYRAPVAKKRDNGPVMPRYPRNVAATGGVTAAMLLGLFSLALVYFTLLGGVTALIGVACAIYGLFSNRKGMAVFALVLCCLVLTIAAWRTGFMLYDHYVMQGTAPAAPVGGF